MKIKSIVAATLFSASALAPHILRAQTPVRYEFDLGYSLMSNNLVTGDDKNYVAAKSSGMISFSSKYYLTHRFTVGLTFAFASSSGTWGPIFADPPILGEPPNMGTYKFATYTITPEVTITYGDLPKGVVRLYGTIGAGLTYKNEVDVYSEKYYEFTYNNGVNPLGNKMQLDNNGTRFNYYIAPIGIRVGRALSGFCEIGYGYKGFINGGIACKIKPRQSKAS